MESKRLGLCQKSLFVVPNHLTEQWATEFLQLYPAANILVATRKDFETKNRKKFCGRIATGDYDAVIIGHSQFEKIPMSVERQRAILEQQIDEIMMGISEAKREKAENFTIKQMMKTQKGLQAKIDKLNDQSRKDDVVTFEELGVDRIFIDESHYFKNLVRFKGIDDTNKEEIKILFEKHGKDISVDSLSTGEKQVVFRGAHLLKNSNSMVGGVVLLDEPELSMHPKWQQKVLEYYRSLFTAEGVQNAQMIFATHSEYVLNSALNDRDNVLIITLTDDNGIIQAKNITAPSTLPTITSAETNYLAFGVVSPDYHIELYGWLQNKAQKLSIKSCDDYISNCSEFVPMEHTKQYLHTDRNGRTTVYQTLPTFIRNSIDHPDSGYSYTENELRKSIELLIKLCR